MLVLNAFHSPLPATLEPDCTLSVGRTYNTGTAAPRFSGAAFCTMEARRIAESDAEAVVKRRNISTILTKNSQCRLPHLPSASASLSGSLRPLTVEHPFDGFGGLGGWFVCGCRFRLSGLGVESGAGRINGELVAKLVSSINPCALQLISHSLLRRYYHCSSLGSRSARIIT